MLDISVLYVINMKNNLEKKPSSNIVLFVNNDEIAIFWAKFGPKLGDFDKILVIMQLLSKALTYVLWMQLTI